MTKYRITYKPCAYGNYRIEEKTLWFWVCIHFAKTVADAEREMSNIIKKNENDKRESLVVKEYNVK
jgi:hypothetical protein